jgi:hypothetical protein
MLVRTKKYANERIAAQINWSTWMGTDTLTGTPTVVPDASGVTVENLSTATPTTTFLIGGGTAGAAPSIITAQANTVGGKRKQIFIAVTILADATA